MILSTQLLILLSNFSSLVSLIGRIEIQVKVKNISDIKFTKNYEKQFPSLEYFLPEKPIS